MKSYVVYKHPNLGIQAVKIGISWPAAIFSVFWLVAHRLWAYSIVWVLGVIACEYIDSVVESVSTGFALLLYLVLFVINIALLLTPAFQGNSWLGEQLEKVGYKESGIISAESIERAIELATRNEHLEKNSSVAA